MEEQNTAEQKPAEQANKQREVRLELPGSLQEIVGSLLFASEMPLTAADLRNCVRGVEPEEGDDKDVMDVYKTCTNREIEEAIRGVEKALEVARCGFRLVCSGGAYRLQTAPSCGRYVRALLKLDRPSRLTRASLETLAIVAYRQPITKAEVEEIRGVGVDTILKTLVDLQLVRLVGRSELPGHPFLYGTTPFFLEHFGLASLDQLNEIDPTLPRSNPRERAKLFKKEEKSQPDLLQPEKSETAEAAEDATESPVADAAAEPAEPAVAEPGEETGPGGIVMAAIDSPDEDDEELDDEELDEDDDEDEDDLDDEDEDDEEDEEDEDEEEGEKNEDD